MELHEAIDRRRSIRRFTSEPVSREEAKRLVDAAIMAPSNLNSQPWRFTVVAGKARDEVAEIVSKSTVYLADLLSTLDEAHRGMAEDLICDFGGAPVIVVISAPRPAEDFQRLNQLVSIGCAVQNLLLEASDMGLGACNITFAFWVRDELARHLRLDTEIVSIVLIGHPAEAPEPPGRDQDVAQFIGFGE